MKRTERRSVCGREKERKLGEKQARLRICPTGAIRRKKPNSLDEFTEYAHNALDKFTRYAKQRDIDKEVCS